MRQFVPIFGPEGWREQAAPKVVKSQIYTEKSAFNLISYSSKFVILN